MTSDTTHRGTDAEAAQRQATIRHAVRRARRRRRLWRRIKRRGGPVLVLLVIAGIGVSLWAAAGARVELLAGRASLEQGRSALLGGDIDRAAAAFSASSRAFDAAYGRVRHPAVRAVAVVPGARNNIGAVAGVARAGGLVARAGSELTSAAIDLPRGPATLAPENGVIPIVPLQQVQPALERAAELVGEAQQVAGATSSTLLAGQVRLAREELLAQVANIHGMLAAADTVTEILPAFLGAEGPRRYFFAAQNPAELRGTGGFIGAYALLSVERGRLTFGPFRSVVDITTKPLPGVPAPSADYQARYGQFGGAGWPQNINMTPDFPTAAEAILNLYEAAKGERLDGVIAADPFALQALVGVTGPVEVPGVGQVEASEIVEVLAVEGFGHVPDSHDRKQVFGAVASEVVTEFLGGPGVTRAAQGAQALVEVASAGHMLFYSADPAVQSGFEALGIDGALPAADGDLVGVIMNNAGANKLDYFTDRSVRYETWLQPDGSGIGIVTITLSSEAPVEDWPLDVIGPNTDDVWPGENINIVSLYLGKGAQLQRVARDPRYGEVDVDEEMGRPVLTSWERLTSGQSRSWSYVAQTPAVWSADGDHGVYRLAWHNQPTIRPTDTEVVVHLPPGGSLVVESGPARPVEDGVAWAGPGERLEAIEVRFDPHGRTDLASEIRDFLMQPLLGTVPTAD